MKICTNPVCEKNGEPQKETDFYRLSRSDDGRDTRCKLCARVRAHEQWKRKQLEKPKQKPEFKQHEFMLKPWR